MYVTMDIALMTLALEEDVPITVPDLVGFSCLKITNSALWVGP